MWFKQSISGWIAKEIHRTEMALLQAEDELANAQLRVKALRSRSARLQGKQDKPPLAPSADADDGTVWASEHTWSRRWYHDMADWFSAGRTQP